MLGFQITFEFLTQIRNLLKLAQFGWMRWGLSWVTSSHTFTRMMGMVIPKIPSASTKRL